MGKYSASSSEWLLDLAYNVENVLIVGENTLGGIIGMTSKISLPNSACQGEYRFRKGKLISRGRRLYGRIPWILSRRLGDSRRSGGTDCEFCGEEL